MKKLLILGLSLVSAITLISCIFYNLGLQAVSNDSKKVEFIVNDGSSYYSVASKLKKAGLIKNELCFKLYVKFNKVNKLSTGRYILKSNMGVKKIIKTLSDSSKKKGLVTITFKEGKNMRYIATTISEHTNNTKEEVFNALKDQEYLRVLVNKYWFINEDILNNNLYYSLEGYLYPNTYEFASKNVSVKEIFSSMLDEMDKKLSSYKDELMNNKYSIHNILTLASIVELEGKKISDRAGIAGVFYNRLNNNWNLGSDVTSYYGVKLELNERDLRDYEVNDSNPYNTRSTSLMGKLPIGPIDNPSIDSVKAVLYPQNSDNYYFVADKEGNTYFSKTYQEHKTIRNKLIKEGLWYTYN